jgi:hypothetical protein
MLTRSLLLVSLLAATAHAARPEHPPDAPPSCIDPVGKDGLPLAIARGPKVIGTYKLINGKTLDTPKLRLLATAHFMAERVGSKNGEWLPGLEVSLLPDVDRDGPAPENSVDQHGYDPLRIGTYRVTVIGVKGKVIETMVEDLGCEEEYVHAPLAANESKTFWVSTEATRTYSFSTGYWFDSVARMYFLVSSGLAPDVQQTPGTKTPHGWISAQAWDSNEGWPSWDDRYLDKLTPGADLETSGYKIKVIKVVLGKDTSVVDGTVVTKGRQPVISALVTVTRKEKRSETAIRNN